MSIQYYVNLKLNALYKHENIKKILQRGIDQGFCYYDHILGERYGESPILDVDQAVNKVIKAYEDNLEGGPCVYTKINETTYGYLYFFEIEELLEFSLGDFGLTHKKYFEEDVYHIDFDYYIRMALDLCKDFAIQELKTEEL